MERLNIYHRKDGRWEGRISRGKRKDGRRKYQYIFARTKDEVVTRMAQIRRMEQPAEKCHKTMEMLFHEWFRSIQHLVKASTAANYLMKAQKHILPVFGEKSVSSIKSDDIYAFISQKQEAGLSVRYIADIMILMKTIFKYAVRTYHIFNPLDGITLPKKKSPEIQLLDDTEQAKLQNYVSTHQNRSTLGTALSITTSIRIGELCALQWRDIDLEKRILTVSKTIQRMQDLKNYARTEEQTRATADKLYDLADYALRVSVDEALRNQEQSQEEEIEPEPDFELQLE